MSKSPFADRASAERATTYGAVLLLITLSILFVAAMIAAIVIRLQATAWPELPPLPGILLTSSGVILVLSAVMHHAASRCRGSDAGSVRHWLVGGCALTIAFLALQAVAWATWRTSISTFAEDSGAQRLAISAFYIFTALHAAHLLGGMVPLAVLAWQSMRGGVLSRSMLRWTGVYFHFLAVTWIALYAMLLLI